jgi:hypothetical protein
MKMPEACVVCGGRVYEGDRHVLLVGRVEQAHCSERCLRAGVRRRLSARSAARRRVLAGAASLAALVLVLGAIAHRVSRLRAPRPRSISAVWPELHGLTAPAPGPILVGPPWPPTDEQWTALFDGASWLHPLPGPVRRSPTLDDHLFGPESPHERPARCRVEGACGVNLGGELWGEHVYAALDGVVERVQGDNEHRGGISVRLVHFGGAVYTQYFHLAATPRGIARGAHVRAGEVIGLVGDTGTGGGRRHLTFALSVRPGDQPEVYWDPTPWIARAPLRSPPHGTVAGYTPPDARSAPLSMSRASFRVR